MGTRDIRDAEYDKYKSNVYSLGICLLSLCSLDIPVFITSLKDLQKNINKRLNGASHYSKDLAKAIGMMATVDEAERPDFLKLESEICKPVIPFVANSYSNATFRDDDKIPIIHRSFTLPVTPISLSMNFALDYLRMDRQVSEEDAAYILRLEAISTVSNRCGLDIVCVLDLCSSKHTPLPLLQSGLRFILSHLSDCDRLSLVSFGKQGTKISRLTSCTPSNKADLTLKIDSLSLEDGSNVSNGLIVGLQALKERREKNGLAAILLFTNGVNEGDVGSRKMCVEALMAVRFDQGLTVHSFVMEEEGDYSMLSALSRESKGSLHLCPTPGSFQTALGLTVGSLTSVVARNIDIKPGQYFEGLPCRTDHMYSEIGTLPVLIPYMSAGQTIELAFTLKANSLTTEHSYHHTASRYEVKVLGNSNEDINLQSTLPLWVVPWAEAPKPGFSPSVLLSFYTKKVAIAVRDAVNAARLTDVAKASQARVILQSMLEEVEINSKKMGESEAEAGKLKNYLEKARKLIGNVGSLTGKEEVRLERMSAALFFGVGSLEMMEYATKAQKECIEKAKKQVFPAEKTAFSGKTAVFDQNKPEISPPTQPNEENLQSETVPNRQTFGESPEAMVLSTPTPPTSLPRPRARLGERAGDDCVDLAVAQPRPRQRPHHQRQVRPGDQAIPVRVKHGKRQADPVLPPTARGGGGQDADEVLEVALELAFEEFGERVDGQFWDGCHLLRRQEALAPPVQGPEAAVQGLDLGLVDWRGGGGTRGEGRGPREKGGVSGFGQGWTERVRERGGGWWWWWWKALSASLPPPLSLSPPPFHSHICRRSSR